MAEKNSTLRPVSIAIAVITVWLIVFLLSFPILEKIYSDPTQFLGNRMSIENFQFLFLSITFIVVGTLIAYIVYLLLTSKSRAALIAGESMKWLPAPRRPIKPISYRG